MVSFNCWREQSRKIFWGASVLELVQPRVTVLMRACKALSLEREENCIEMSCIVCTKTNGYKILLHEIQLIDDELANVHNL